MLAEMLKADLDIQDFNPAFLLLDPQRARPEPSGDIPVRSSRSSRNLIRTRLIMSVRRVPIVGRRNQRAFSDGNDVRDAERMQHVRITRMCPADPTQVNNPTHIIIIARTTHKFPKYKNGRTLDGKLPSNLGSLNHAS